MNKYGLLLLILLVLNGWAKTITVRDLADREVTLSLPLTQVFLLDSRDIIALDIVAGEKALTKLSGLSGSLAQFAPDIAKQYFKQFPWLAALPELGKTGGDLNAESLIKLKPKLVIATLWSYPVLLQNGTLEQLGAAQIPVLFIDFKYHNPENAIKSITLLGEIFQSTARAQAFNQFYLIKLAEIKKRLTGIKSRRRVLLEKHAGIRGVEDCCLFYGEDGLGKLARLAGGDNLAATLVNDKGGKLSMEQVLTLQPDYFIVTGADLSRYHKKVSVVQLGYQADPQQAARQLTVLTQRQGFAQVDAVKKRQVMAIYNHYYDDPFSIIVIEVLAKFFYPDLFDTLHPQHDLQTLHQQFMSIPANGVFWQRLN